MLKKVCACLLTGTIALSAAACVDGGATKKSTESSQGTLHEKESKDSKYKSTFKESLFYGDSIFEAISSYELLDDKNIFAGNGKAAFMALEKTDGGDDVDEIAKRSPKHIFMNLGMNDLYLPGENPVKLAVSNYVKVIQKVKEKLPNIKIHLMSITPVSEELLAKDTQLKQINDLNVAIKDMAKSEKVDFIDLSPIFEKNNIKDLYDKKANDGMHFDEKYYPILFEHVKGYVK
ncbi:GDSL-type esterase/lipase family protein [Bacillus cereus]